MAGFQVTAEAPGSQQNHAGTELGSLEFLKDRQSIQIGHP